MSHTTVYQALRRASSGAPSSVGDMLIDMPMHELICLKLLDIANNPDPRIRGSVARAARAQKIYLDRLVGKRAPGTAPVTLQQEGIEFHDLTGELTP